MNDKDFDEMCEMLMKCYDAGEEITAPINKLKQVDERISDLLKRIASLKKAETSYVANSVDMYVKCVRGNLADSKRYRNATTSNALQATAQIVYDISQYEEKLEELNSQREYLYKFLLKKAGERDE